MSYKNILSDDSLTYDDVSLLPNQISEIEHRSDCDTSVNFCGIKLSVPIIASPMNTVCGGRMAKALSELGTLGILHRFNTPEEQVAEFKDNGFESSEYLSAAIGISENTEIERLKVLADYGVKIYCID
ncbi:MAG: IMP dehydrogenase, partial [Ignavibacteriota bacterium]